MGQESVDTQLETLHKQRLRVVLAEIVRISDLYRWHDLPEIDFVFQLRETMRKLERL